MPARKVAKKTAKKGGTIDADLTSIAVPFGLLLAKQSLEKLSGTKVKATKGKKVAKNVVKAKTAKRMKRAAVGGNSANVPGVNTMAHKTGANVGGKSVKRGRGRPRSRVGGNANAANASVNVPSGVNTMAHKTGANVGGKGKRKITKSKKGGRATNSTTVTNSTVPASQAQAAKAQAQAQAAAKAQAQAAAKAQAQAVKAVQGNLGTQGIQDGGKSKAKRGRGRPRKN
jgi:hypothetical protein